jgi:phosphoglucosamine mutase
MILKALYMKNKHIDLSGEFMERKLFGTDGIRGKANVYPMTCEIAIALGRAVTHYFQTHSQNKKPLIIVGKDTRLSCYMLEKAFSAGVCSQGGEVILTGPLPTPGVAFVTKSMRATAGVMISASHNNFDDNGIKIFDNKGFKLPDLVELEIEKLVLDPSLMKVMVGEHLGNAKRLKEVFGRYLVHAKSVVPDSFDLSGMRIVVDCAHGAAYKVAPIMFNELGAEVFTIGVNPNGTNINDNCGSTSTSSACQKVLEHRADLGICLDGDADRVIFIDEKGQTLDGDKVIGLFAKLMLKNGTLKRGDTVVGTVMTNLGLEHYLKKLGLNLIRTKVGDRYIVEEMRKINAVLGGEPSGHIILLNHSTTGDGTLAALKMIEGMKYFGKTLSELEKEVLLFPQVIKNAIVSKKIPLESVKSIQDKLESVTKLLGNKGRVLLRYSGTEPLARVMVEGEDQEQVSSLCEELSHVVSTELK